MEEAVNLSTVIDQVCREKNISRQVLTDTVEQAVLAAAKKVFEDREIEANFDPETGHVSLFQVLYVVDEVVAPNREISVEQAERGGEVDHPTAHLGAERGVAGGFEGRDTFRGRNDLAGAHDVHVYGRRRHRLRFGSRPFASREHEEREDERAHEP